MCGIVGYVGPKGCVDIIVSGLRRLEYRGYDSAGVAVVGPKGLAVRRAKGKLANLESLLAKDPLAGTTGIGHTRWATHGRPTEENAHPHRDCTGRIVVVHNGIIENYLDLKQQLEKEGHRFVTETDTEIVAHLVEREMQDDGLENAVRRALLYMRGLFALVLISADDPEKIVAVRNGPPIVVGLGDGEFFVASLNMKKALQYWNGRCARIPGKRKYWRPSPRVMIVSAKMMMLWRPISKRWKSSRMIKTCY